MAVSALLLVLSLGHGVSSGLHPFFKSSRSLCSLALGAVPVHAGSWGHFRNTCSAVRPHFHFSWPLDLYVVSILETCHQIFSNVANYR